MRSRASALAVLIAVPLVLAACGEKKDAAPTGATTSESTPATTTEATTTQPQATTVEVTPPPAGSNGAKAVKAYKAYLVAQSAVLMKQITVFTTALREGDPETAVKTYGKARAAYESLQRVAARLGLDPAMNAQEGTVPASEWSGFHMIEKTIFDTGTTGGTEEPAARLMTDATAVRDSVKELQLDPELILRDMQDLLARIADTTVEPSEEPYSLANLYAMSGDLRSAEAAWRALRPLVAANDRSLAAELDGAFQTAVVTIESNRVPGRGFRSYDELGDLERTAIVNAVNVARESLASADISE